MPDDATPGWAETVRAAIKALTGWRRQVVLTGFAAGVALFASCFVLILRLTSKVEPTALTPVLALALDAKLLAMAVAATIAMLVWLAATLYALYQNR